MLAPAYHLLILITTQACFYVTFFKNTITKVLKNNNMEVI